MPPRRRFPAYDNLAPSHEPRWLNTYDKHSRLSSSFRQEPGTDLRAAMRGAAAQLAADGWVIESDPAEWIGTFFANRDGDRRQVSMMPAATLPDAFGSCFRWIHREAADAHRQSFEPAGHAPP